MLVISAPSPMFGKLKNKLSSKKGKEKVEGSSNTAEATFHVEPGAGMSASTLFRDHHRGLVDSSRQAISDHGGRYHYSLRKAKEIINQGYKPGPKPSTIDGGRLRPKEVESLTASYAKAIRKQADHVKDLKSRQHALKGPIATYQKGGQIQSVDELTKYKKDLQVLKFKWRAPPHEHRSISSLDLVHYGHQEAAHNYLDNEIASVEEILNRHGIHH
jgi:hypothetical protein